MNIYPKGKLVSEQLIEQGQVFCLEINSKYIRFWIMNLSRAITISNILTLSVQNEGYSRNASRALN